MGRVLVVHAVEGRVVESTSVEGSLYDVLAGVVRDAVGEWDPRRSDFLVMRDRYEFDAGDLRVEGDVEGVERRGGRVLVTVFLVSYDNDPVEGESGRIVDYRDRRLYLVAPDLGDDFRALVEVEAAGLTSPREPPKGLRHS